MNQIPHALSAHVQLWRVDLDAYPDVGVPGVLSLDEIARAERLAFDHDRKRYRAAHRALRAVLATAASSMAGSLIIEADELGKPRVCNAGTLEFSLSHSANECLIGVAAGVPVGVDIEVPHAVANTGALVGIHFTATEQAEWARTPAHAREHTFLTCWVRKEACLKALGIGLSARPSDIEVGCSDETRVAVMSLGTRRCHMQVCSLPLHDRTVGAAAIATPQDAMFARQYFARDSAV